MSSKNAVLKKIWFLGLLISLLVPFSVRSDLASPAWVDPDGVSNGDDWHYRVPVTILFSSGVGSVSRIAVDVDTLTSNLGVTGTADMDSLRLIRPNGSELSSYEFVDGFFNAAPDALGNNQGDVLFELEDATPTTYYLYFDITENGAKPALAANMTNWFDLNWNRRIPITIDNTANASTLTEYQLYLDINSSFTDFWSFVDTSGDDIRLTNEAGDVEYDYHLQRFDASAEQANIWVQVDSIAGSSTQTMYLYYDNSSASAASDAESTFDYGALTATHAVVSENIEGGDVEVISLYDGNTVTDGTTTLNLDRGDRGTLTNVDGADEISSLKPFYARGIGDGKDALVPLSFASSSFIGPTERSGTQTWSFYAPFGDATITIEDGPADGSPSVTLLNAGNQIEITKDITSTAHSAVITSTLPVVGYHNVGLVDPFVLIPPATDLYGMFSNDLFIGFGTDGTTGTAFPSSGSSTSIPGDRGDRIDYSGAGSNGGQGTGDGYFLTSSQPIAAISQADSDGTDSSSYLPFQELNREYFIPTDAEYIAIICPQDTNLTLFNPSDTPIDTATCNASGNNPGKAIFNATVYAAGHYVIGDEVFYAYYEDDDHDDETNLFGASANRKFTHPHPTHSFGATDTIGTLPLGSEEGFGIDITSSVGPFVCNDVVTVTVDSDVGMFLNTGAGDTIELQVFDDDAVLYDTLTLHDDGSTGTDASADDGIYTGVLTFPGVAGFSGTWQLVARAGTPPTYDNGYVASDVQNVIFTCGFQPDAKIRNASGGPFVGNNVYESSAMTQVSAQNIDNAETASFDLQFQNDGQITDTIVITGPASVTGGGGTFAVTYRDGNTDITSQVTGPGFVLSNVSVAANENVEMDVTAGLSVADGTTVNIDVTATSNIDTNALDMVRASVGVSAMDDDGDGITNGQETFLGMDPNNVDSDGDTIRDDAEMTDFDDPEDTDEDGTIDALDLDSDGDQIDDAVEAGDANLATAPVDTDGDGIPDFQDLDADNDGTPDVFEGIGDDDRDGVPNYLDTNNLVANTDQFVGGGDLQGGGGCRSQHNAWWLFLMLTCWWMISPTRRKSS